MSFPPVPVLHHSLFIPTPMADPLLTLTRARGIVAKASEYAVALGPYPSNTPPAQALSMASQALVAGVTGGTPPYPLYTPDVTGAGLVWVRGRDEVRVVHSAWVIPKAPRVNKSTVAGVFGATLAPSPKRNKRAVLFAQVAAATGVSAAAVGAMVEREGTGGGGAKGFASSSSSSSSTSTTALVTVTAGAAAGDDTPLGVNERAGIRRASTGALMPPSRDASSIRGSVGPPGKVSTTPRESVVVVEGGGGMPPPPTSSALPLAATVQGCSHALGTVHWSCPRQGRGFWASSPTHSSPSLSSLPPPTTLPSRPLAGCTTTTSTRPLG